LFPSRLLSVLSSSITQLTVWTVIPVPALSCPNSFCFLPPLFVLSLFFSAFGVFSFSFDISDFSLTAVLLSGNSAFPPRIELKASLVGKVGEVLLFVAPPLVPPLVVVCVPEEKDDFFVAGPKKTGLEKLGDASRIFVR
jgi:hypothetical protein